MTLAALIFDLDGTLVDTNRFHIDSWARTLAHAGYAVARDRIMAEIGKGGDNLVPSLLGEAPAARDGEAIRARVATEFAETAGRNRFAFFPGARELLAEVRQRGLKLALATSSSEEQIATTFRSAGEDLRPRFDAVVTASDVDRSKPAPDVIHAALTRLDLSPSDCVLVGDTPHDAEAARRAGVVMLGVAGGGTTTVAALRRAGATGVWRDTADLLAHLDAALAIASTAASGR
ncbi:MAG: hypothetical protein NVS1B4_21670 [Gemmatimonadaceae bacterium]